MGRGAEEAAVCMERARQSLKAAQTLCEAGLFDDSASRAYYAVFHAATAVFMLRGMAFKKHGGVIGAVHKELVHEGLIDVEAGKWLAWLFELRSVGDYGEIIHVDATQAELALARARSLVEAFQRLSTDV